MDLICPLLYIKFLSFHNPHLFTLPPPDPIPLQSPKKKHFFFPIPFLKILSTATDFQYMGLSNCRKLVALSLLLSAAAVFSSLSVASSEPHSHRKLLLLEDEDGESVKKKTTTTLSSSLSKTSGSAKNKTKLLKPSSSSFDSTDSKPVKPVSSSLKNKTKAEGDGYGLEKIKLKKLNSTSKIKAVKSGSDSSSSSKSGGGDGYSLEKIKLKKLNSTSDSAKSSSITKLKKLNSTSKAMSSSDSAKSGSISAKKAADLLKSPKSNADEETQPAAKKKINPDQNQKKKPQASNSKTLSPPSWFYSADEDDDLVSEFRDLPNKFQKTFIPDLQRISTSSQIYLSKANKQITNNFKPYVGNKYASPAATAISCAFIIIPFLLVSLLFNRIKAFFSLQKLLIFIQVYLAIYFTILCLSSLVTGLEPLKFFYATSRATYVWLQVLQTLGYVLYLLLLLMYLILVFSTAESGLGSKFLGLAQTLVGFAVGLHYYMTVFHRVVLHQPPKTNWKVHAVYATCFLLICLLASADRRKKAYLSEGGEEGKKS